MTALRMTEKDDHITFEVRVVPRSSRAEIAGIHDGALRVCLTAPPVDGAANAALVAFMAQTLGVPKRAVTIVRGETGRQKVLAIQGVDAARARAVLTPAGA